MYFFTLLVTTNTSAMFLRFQETFSKSLEISGNMAEVLVVTSKVKKYIKEKGFKIVESKMFTSEHGANRGNFFMLFKGKRFFRYICCIVIGVPVYFTTGVLFTFAPELTAGLGVVGTVSAGNAILYGSIGLTLGDLLSGTCKYDEPKKSYGVHPGIVVKCEGKKWKFKFGNETKTEPFSSS